VPSLWEQRNRDLDHILDSIRTDQRQRFDQSPAGLFARIAAANFLMSITYAGPEAIEELLSVALFRLATHECGKEPVTITDTELADQVVTANTPKDESPTDTLNGTTTGDEKPTTS
jgi:hypothetical protein